MVALPLGTRRRCGWAIAAALLAAAPAGAAFGPVTVDTAGPPQPLTLLAEPAEPPSVYAPPEAERPEDLTNRAGSTST